MSLSRLLTMILMVTSMIVSMSAQEEPSKRKGKLEVGPGITFLGPASQMAEHMNEYRFNQISHTWIWDNHSDHPHYGSWGVSLQISYSHYLGSRSQLGILFQISSLNTAHGHADPGGNLDIGFSNISLVPLFTFDLGESWDIQVGPALMINLANQHHSENEVNYINYTKLSPGLLSGLNLKIYDSRIFYLKIGIQYLLTTYNKIGPYTCVEGEGATTLPESRVNFSHLKIHFVFGWHL